MVVSECSVSIKTSTGAPPDVTRGTPTSLGPEDTDPVGDELLAFVEQDKTRTERIKRRYDTDSSSSSSSGCLHNANGGETAKEDAKKAESNEDDENDELNDYGFNKRPSVRGIRPQFSSTSDIVQQLRTRSLAATNRSALAASWHLCDGGADLNIAENAINKINGMHQKHVDDIYQAISETTTISVQQGTTLERGSYLESTLPRGLGELRGFGIEFLQQKSLLSYCFCK